MKISIGRFTLVLLLQEAKEDHTLDTDLLPHHSWEEYYGTHIHQRLNGANRMEARNAAINYILDMDLP